MSLDFYLYELAPVPATLCTCDACGHEHTVLAHDRKCVVFSRNITHNLGAMANAAGIYTVLWRPEETTDPKKATEIEALEKAERWAEARTLRDTLTDPRARDLIPALEEGIAWLRAHETEARVFDAPNGWGLYEHLVPFAVAVRDACLEYPDAFAEASR